jgi:hypothetical protein
MSDPVVHITAGIPDSGTGNITTLGQTLVDGANIVQGATTDAAVTAGAAGSLSAKLRSISRDLVANIVLAAGANVIGAVTQSGNWVLAAGSALIGVVKIGDGTNTAGVAPASTLALATQPAVVVALRPDTVNANGQTTMSASAPVTLPSDQKYQTGMSPKGFSAAFTTLTRPANTTAYTAGNSISNNATAGSVTALSATVSDTNNDPVTLTELLIASTDTGLAGKRIRAYLFNSDPTANSGVGGGNGAAYSQKQAGYIGSMSGVLEAGFSDGTVGRLVPTYADGAAAGTPNAAAGGFIVTNPTSGAKTIYVQDQAIDAFTPSANSTTIIGTARGFQGRAA